ncbi:outer membrane beta-barrel protein [Mucilaginibacter sp. UYCu711]|uniref:outer membrane beta-barrel protein n=1 Tax=Mucilaginibacter sp. UYCu711 TaxID=3156339 RepID=UPI003D1EAE9D
MKRSVLLFVMVLFCSFYSRGQSAPNKTISGLLTDSTGASITGAEVILTSNNRHLYTISNDSGKYIFKNVGRVAFQIKIKALGYKPFVGYYNVEHPSELSTIILKMVANQLKEVIITAVPSINLKRDTIQYNIAKGSTVGSDVIEDLLKRLPGITVDRDGTIKTNGRIITKLRLEGKDFFAGNISAVLKSFPADIIKNIQVINDYGDLANVSGIKTGAATEIINISLKDDKKIGVFGNLTGAAGTDHRYMASGSLNSFNKQQQLSVVSSINNTNAGSMGSITTGGNGITLTKSAGLNYRNNISKSLTVYGNYNFSDNINTTQTATYIESVYPGYSLTSNQTGIGSSKNRRHQFNLNIEYNGRNDYFKFSPSFGLTSSNTTNKSVSVINNFNSISTLYNTLNIGGNQNNLLGSLLYNHKFSKPGRNLSLNFNSDFTKNSQERNIDNQMDSLATSANNPSNQHLLTNEADNTKVLSGSFDYNEPLSSSTSLNINYTYSHSNTKSIINTGLIDPKTLLNNHVDSLSDIYTSKFITNTGSIKFRTVNDKSTFLYGVDVISTGLMGKSLARDSTTSYHALNLDASARFTYAIGKKSSFSIHYKGNSVSPSFLELQPIRDVSNPQNEMIGNPGLKPEFYHTLKFQYNAVNPDTHSSFFSNVDFNIVQNKIVSDRLARRNSIIQQTSFVNTNGYKSVRGFYSLTKAVKSDHYFLTLSGSGDLSNNISFVNDEKSSGQNLIINQLANFRISFPGIIENEVAINYTLNYSSYNQPSSTSSSQTINLGIMGKKYVKKQWVVNYDFIKELNSGYKGVGAKKPLIINLAIERKLFKNDIGSLTLSAFDLLNQSTGLQRTVVANQIIDTKTNSLGRYFLLSFNIRLQKFAGVK